MGQERMSRGQGSPQGGRRETRGWREWRLTRGQWVAARKAKELEDASKNACTLATVDPRLRLALAIDPRWGRA